MNGLINYEDDKHFLKRLIIHPPLIPLSEYSLFSERAIHARLIGFFREKQKRALGALKNVIKLTKSSRHSTYIIIVDNEWQILLLNLQEEYNSDFTGADLVVGVDQLIGIVVGYIGIEIF